MGADAGRRSSLIPHRGRQWRLVRRLEVTQRNEEVIQLADGAVKAAAGLLSRRTLASTRIEEAVRLAFVGFQFAAIACGEHRLGKEFCRGKWHRLVLCAVEENARRQPGADEVIRRYLLRTAVGAGADIGDFFV